VELLPFILVISANRERRYLDGFYLLVQAEYKINCIASRALTNAVSANQKRMAIKRQTSALDASEILDFELQDAHYFLLVIWLP
jgi:hypothetical protein